MKLLPSRLEAVHHDGGKSYVSNTRPRLGETVMITLRSVSGCSIDRVFLRHAPDGEQHLIDMKPERVGALTLWRAELVVREPVVGYYFMIAAADGIWWLSGTGVQAHQPLDAFAFRLSADFDGPEWVTGSVLYQIFPDTFAVGDPANDPSKRTERREASPYTTYPWGAVVPDEAPFGTSFFGGDLPGIIEKLDYLAGLGVDTLYLTPVFEAPSNHRYDVTDYGRVDPFLGGDEALIALRRALDARGMRFILDIVPNHCGHLHPWFETAKRDPTSPEHAFFTFENHPDGYHTWLFFQSLVKLDYRSDELRRRMITGPDSVFRKWLRPPFRADGWRIDVANMLGRDGAVQMNAALCTEIRQVVRETAPHAYLIGEHVFDASCQLQGDQWDGVMNYAGFRNPLLAWLNGFSIASWGHDRIASPVPFTTEALVGTWAERMAVIPYAVALQQMTILDSHDTDRIRSRLGADAKS